MKGEDKTVAKSFYSYRQALRDKYNSRQMLFNLDPKYFEAYLSRGILNSPVVKQSKKDELRPYIEHLKELDLLDG